MTSRRALRLIAVASAATIGLAACGGSDSSSSSQATVEETSDTTVERAASADGTTCPEQNSMTFDGYIMNGLPRGVKLSAQSKDWTCNDWSGVSTPGGVFNDMYLVSGARTPYRLERARIRKAIFTLRAQGQWMENFTEKGFDGDIRLGTYKSPPGFPDGSYSPDSIDGSILTQKEFWKGSRVCYFFPIATAPSSWSDTPVNEVLDAFAWTYETTDHPWVTNKSAMFIVDKGRIGLVFTYGDPSNGKTSLCD